ncbi:MAG TPA: MCP four helix bundle domain-containing protein, partial [Chthoniobacteraceae bacterium]
MTIARRLVILLAVPLVALVGFGLFAGLQFSRIEERSRFVAQTQVPSLAALGNISRCFTEMRVNVRDHLLATNKAEQTTARSLFDSNEADLQRLLRQYADTLIADEKDRRLLNDFRESSRDWIAAAKKSMELSAQGHRQEAQEMLGGAAGESAAHLSKVSREWIQHNEGLAEAESKAIVASLDDARWQLLGANVAVVAATSLLALLTLRRIVAPIQALEASVKTIAAGDYAKEVPFIEATDETGGLARSVDVLKQGAAAMEAQRWVKASAAKLTGDLQGAASLGDFGQRLVSGLVPILGGGVAGFYLREENPDRLRRIAAYGLAESSAAESFGMGEGLIGQCARERKAVSLGNLPPDYLRIASGLGAAAPVQAVAAPLLSKNALLGVLEVATFRAFNTQEKTLLEEVLPVVAMSLEVLQRNLHTQELLGQTREQARQLEVKEARLRETEQFFRSVLELAPDGLMVVNARGVIQLANVQCEKLFGYTREELIGQPVEILVPATLRAHHPDLREGFHQSPEARRMGSGRELCGQRKDGSL